jgi:hypothetical protein
MNWKTARKIRSKAKQCFIEWLMSSNPLVQKKVRRWNKKLAGEWMVDEKQTVIKSGVDRIDVRFAIENIKIQKMMWKFGRYASLIK